MLKRTIKEMMNRDVQDRGNDQIVRIQDELYDFNVSAEEAAKERGCYVVVPKANEVFIDIDSEKDYQDFIRRFHNFSMVCCAIITKDIPSKSGLPHRHIYIDIMDKEGNPMELDDWQRVAIQFTLGSDNVKETLSVFRAISGVECPSRFFEPKKDL
jgi:hypothetical protein